MNYRLFQYGLPAPPELDDLNSYLRAHRVATVAHHIVQTTTGALLVFVVETVDSSANKSGSSGQAKVDYRERLTAEEFAVFSRLRDARKKWAEAEGVPVYTVFSNAQGTTAFVSVWFAARWKNPPDDASSCAPFGGDETRKCLPRAEIRLRAEKARGRPIFPGARS